MDLEDVKLSEITQKKAITILFLSCVESKTNKTNELTNKKKNRNKPINTGNCWVPRGGAWEEWARMCEKEWEIQASSYGMNVIGIWATAKGI